ncbi:MAG: hypothetical protein CME65_05130 [Halobacteriovoraceae bacterium]|nr:hypothetical protein [Halobacteriovoraceae bacterium]|tara:strand:+ start:243 stop:473 length:231 start_codon:yes stop_codon:yes gene_type:complete
MKTLILGLLVSSSAFALTGDVSRPYEVDRQLESSFDREPQSSEFHQEFVGPKLPHQKSQFHKKQFEPEGTNQGNEQ